MIKPKFAFFGVVLILLLNFNNSFGQFETLATFCNTTDCELYTDGAFAIWWDKSNDFSADAPTIANELKAIRASATSTFGMMDPPNIVDGFYYNVYIHDAGPDLFPDEWGNGQGTDENGYPFLTLPSGYHTDIPNLKHEGFHIFQYNSTNPGYEYAGDAAWYIEASANWFASVELPSEDRIFLESAAVAANPFLTMWHGFENGASGDPRNWQRDVHQYGMNSYLFFLTEVSGVDRDVITAGFYSNTGYNPQKYLFEEQGADIARSNYADFAAQTTADYAYLTRAQYDIAINELNTYGDPSDINYFINELTDEGTGGTWTSPINDETTRGWSYNVVKIENTGTETYTFMLDGDATGSSGAEAHFEGRAVVMTNGVPTYYPFEMITDQDGNITVEATADDQIVYFVVAATPAHFTGNQKYGYQYKILTSSESNNAPTLADAEVTFESTITAGMEVLALAGDDIDEDPLYYTIASGNTDNTFAIDIETGIITLANINFDVTTDPTFELTVAVTDGLASTDATIVVNFINVETVTSLSNVALDQSFRLYPNPAREYIKFTLSNNLMGKQAKVTIYSLSGKNLNTVEITLDKESTLPINDLDKGTYFVKIDVEGQSLYQKLIK